MLPEAPRIALVKLGAIGDVVNTLPFVERLRAGRPAAELTWIIGRLAHSLVEGHPAVDRFLALELDRPGRWRAELARLRAPRFDLVIDLQRILKSGLVARATGAPRRLGFDRQRSKELSWLFATEHIAPNPRPGVTVAQYLEFADHLGLPPSPLRWRLPYVPWEREERPDAPLVVVNVGASKEANQWRPERWARLCERLVEEEGAVVELSGGPVDRAATAELRRLARVPLGDRAGTLDLKRTAGLLAAADLFIGCDTGPLHIAVAVGTPAVALFGAADPARTGPFGQGEGVVYRPAPCSPCRKRTCAVPGHPCMDAIAPELVLERARAVLARSRQPALLRSAR